MPIRVAAETFKLKKLTLFDYVKKLKNMEYSNEWNRNTFREQDFSPAIVMNWPLESTFSTAPTVERHTETAPFTPFRNPPAPITRTAIGPVRADHPIVLPSEIRSYPKAVLHDVSDKRKRTPGRTQILTQTPEKSVDQNYKASKTTTTLAESHLQPRKNQPECRSCNRSSAKNNHIRRECGCHTRFSSK